MSDFYTEQLIKKRTDGKDIMKKTVLIALTVISFFAAFLFPLLMLLPVIMIVVDVFLFRKLDVEYEYISMVISILIRSCTKKRENTCFLQM